MLMPSHIPIYSLLTIFHLFLACILFIERDSNLHELTIIPTNDMTIINSAAPPQTHKPTLTHAQSVIKLEAMASSICDRTIMSTSILPSTSTSRALQSAISTSMPWGMQVIPMKACISHCKCRIAITATMPIQLAAAFEEKKLYVPPQLRSQTTRSLMSPEKVELFKSLEGWTETSILPLLKSVEKCWQPQDFLPEPSSDGFWDELQELRASSSELPDDYLVCLVGDMITEEALPTYQSMLNRTAGVSDETGASLTSWARWSRAWTAEENRHGDLLNKYLYLTGRVDMRAIEKTIQYLIGSGMDPQTERSPYLIFIYTSFQERATFISHGNTARQAKYFGDMRLAQICGAIAADERRHETAYSRIVEKLFEVDPDCTMLALEEMMRKKIVMPAHHMYDGHNKNLFDRFATVAQKTGVYTVKDYADILEHFIKRWKVDKVVGLSSRGQQAQEYVCGLAHRMRRVEGFAWKSKRGTKSETFSWIFNREVALR